MAPGRTQVWQGPASHALSQQTLSVAWQVPLWHSAPALQPAPLSFLSVHVVLSQYASGAQS